MAEAQKAAKAANYTTEMVDRMIALYSELGNDGVEAIAAELGKPVRSVRSKLVREGVYVAAPNQLHLEIGLAERHTNSSTSARSHHDRKLCHVEMSVSPWKPCDSRNRKQSFNVADRPRFLLFVTTKRPLLTRSIVIEK